MTDPIVGIDLGTSNSVVAHADATGQVKVLADDAGGKVHPSVVSFHPNGGVVVGAAAKQRKVIDPSNTIYSVKRLIGRAYRSPEVQTAKARSPFQIKEGPNNAPLIATRGGEFAVPEISAIVLDHVRNVAAARLETVVNRAVVTVPASFNDAQRSATATAGAIAGLTVVRVLNEPTAAALAYGHTRHLREIIAVYDFGGGTFDITFLKLEDQVYEVLGTSGDTFLGGDDLDERLVEKMVAKFLAENRMDLRDNEVAMMRLRAVAEQTKIELSRRSRAVVRIDEIAYGARGAPLNLQIEISRDEFVREVADLIDRTFPVCAEAMGLAGLGTEQIADVILVGGSTKIPYVREQVARFFGKPARTDVNPEDAVAAGAALQATSLERILARRPSTKMRALQKPVAVDDDDEATANAGMLELVEPSGATMAPSELSLAPPPALPQTRQRQPTAGYATRPTTEVTKPDTRYSMTRSGVRDEVADPDRYPAAPPPPEIEPSFTPTQSQPIGRISRNTPTAMTAAPAPPGPRTVYGVPAAPAAFEVELSNSVQFPEVPVRPVTTPGPAVPPVTVAALPPPVPRRTAGMKAQLAPHQTTQPLPPDLRSPSLAPQEYPALELDVLDEPGPSVTQPLAPSHPIAPPTAPTMMITPSVGATTARGLGAFDPDPATTSRGFAPPPSHAAPIGYPPPSAPPPSFSPVAPAYVPPPPPVLLEVTPRGLGIATVAGFSETLIRRNARVPTEARKLFTTSRDRQDTVRIVVCQGESRRLEQNTVIGDLVLQNLPPRPRGETSIEVTFSLDAGGVLQVRARDAQTGAEQRATLALVGDVAQEEVAASRERLQQLRR